MSGGCASFAPLTSANTWARPTTTAPGSTTPFKTVITSAHNPKVKLVRRLLGSRRQRERLGLFVCEGEDLVAAALETGIEPVDALVDAERPALTDRLEQPELVASEVLRAVSTLG